jgi:bifunctional non-homologous end joining protein LigD
MVFDLDPGPPAGVLAACTIALELRDRLASIGLVPSVKMSGAKGVHVLVPVRAATYDDTKRFARTVAEVLEREMPDRVVARMTRSLRAGKVLVDWSQNDAGKSTVAPYSLRAGLYPTVAMPVTWDEIGRAVDHGDEASLRFLPEEALARVARLGDLLTEPYRNPQVLPD